MSDVLSGREMARQLEDIRLERAQLLARVGELRGDLFATVEFRELAAERDVLEDALHEARERLEFTASEAEKLREMNNELRSQRRVSARLASRWRWERSQTTDSSTES